MGDSMCRDFQQVVDKHLIRHRSILDVLTKLQESTARVNRAAIKSVTTCGCLQITASRQQLPENASYCELKKHVSTHLEGSLCENCRERLESEIGQALFYLVALCDLLGLKVDEVIEQEANCLSTLGVYSLT